MKRIYFCRQHSPSASAKASRLVTCEGQGLCQILQTKHVSGGKLKMGSLGQCWVPQGWIHCDQDYLWAEEEWVCWRSHSCLTSHAHTAHVVRDQDPRFYPWSLPTALAHRALKLDTAHFSSVILIKATCSSLSSRDRKIKMSDRQSEQTVHFSLFLMHFGSFSGWPLLHTWPITCSNAFSLCFQASDRAAALIRPVNLCSIIQFSL